MYDDYFIYAFSKKERRILSENKNIISGKVKLSSKDVKVYFYLKKFKGEIGLVDLVKKCLIDQGYDINSPELYKPRKKANGDGFYETGTFWGKDEYRVDTFSRSLGKLIKAGLVRKKKVNDLSFFRTVSED